MAVKTVRKLAAITATLHDGKNMIVLHEGRYVRVSVESLDFLRGKKAIDETGEAGLDRDDDGNAGGSLENEHAVLKGKNKAQLLAIAAEEGADVGDATTNADIVAAIELKREADSDAGDDEGSNDEQGDDGNAGGEADASDNGDAAP